MYQTKLSQNQEEDITEIMHTAESIYRTTENEFTFGGRFCPCFLDDSTDDGVILCDMQFIF